MGPLSGLGEVAFAEGLAWCLTHCKKSALSYRYYDYCHVMVNMAG